MWLVSITKSSEGSPLFVRPIRTRHRVAAAVAAGMSGLLLAGAINAPAGPNVSPAKVQTLRVNTLTDPIGVGDAAPELSWRLSSGRQTAYEVRVASSEAQLENPDLWDSGKVASTDSNNVVYAGARLTRARPRCGTSACGTAPAQRATGALPRAGRWACWPTATGRRSGSRTPTTRYVTDGVPNPLPVFAKPFQATGQVAKARLYMTGLGQYAAKLNGQPVGDAVLEPGQTSYFAEVNYRTYDVTPLLQARARTCSASRPAAARTSASSRQAATSSRTTRRRSTARRRRSRSSTSPTPTAPSRRSAPTRAGAPNSGGTTFSSWWSGEDYDARRQPTDWTSTPTLSGSGWRDAGLVTLTPTHDADGHDAADRRSAPAGHGRSARRTRSRSRQVTRAALNTTLVASASAGDTNVKLASITGLNPGDTVTVDGEARTLTRRRHRRGRRDDGLRPAAAGDTNLKVGSITGFVAGQQAVIDNELVTVSAIGTAGTATTLSAAAAVGRDQPAGRVGRQPRRRRHAADRRRSR